MIVGRRCRHTSYASATLLAAWLRFSIHLSHRLRPLPSRSSSAAATARSLVGDFIAVFVVFIAVTMLRLFFSCR